ncbi:hypothetical protein QBC38DRAFT_455462 [Podospora fimiseda]|uniref:Nephrocystin 3-like N-terminal domain-containing protein n=1 Tax=Podospora fimiseda TaxID=252190 RepID=A0AAN7BPR7_9PEZI|nr:hypothetical protein QBC38DRAFT_455462 [Podospora fimiseda]
MSSSTRGQSSSSPTAESSPLEPNVSLRYPTISPIGITTVYDPGDETELDIVLVHGLFGHPENTWTAGSRPEVNPDSSDGVFWPYDLLPAELPRARILIWGYDVQIGGRSAPSTASILDHSETLLSSLNAIRKDKQRQIIFMAHSLGGIVVKYALSSPDPLAEKILQATTGVMFFGTPHQGSEVAALKLGKIARKICAVFVKIPNPRIVEALERGSDVLELISRNFLAVLNRRKIRVHSFREELKTGGTGGILVVDGFSSRIGWAFETHGLLHADHRQMVKFTLKRDPNFERVVAVLHRWLDTETEKPETEEGPTPPLTPDPRPLDPPAADDIPDELTLSQYYQHCLDSLNFMGSRNRVLELKNPYEDTSRWMLNRDTVYSRWLRGTLPKPIFWIQGKPGSGKSVLMKYASESDDTVAFLREFCGGPWTIIPYFFDDQGPAIQKSTEGLLREVLYWILSHYPSIFSIVFNMLKQKGIIPLPNPPSPTLLKRPAEFWNPPQEPTKIWTPSLMREALKQIGKKAQLDMNLCIFVDALDEHNGDQKDLIEVLDVLLDLEKSPSIKLRMCLASRPENIFRDKFSTYPTLVVQDHNRADICRFTTKRLNKNGDGQSQVLVDEVLRKAQGVFLWVRLVVEELEGVLRDGGTQEDVMRVLEEIPSELTEFYTRALLRSRRSSSGITAHSTKETYCILKIASAWDEPVWVDFLLAAGIFLAYPTKSGRLPERMINSLGGTLGSRRLYSRSAGFLESPGRGSDKDARAEFIHQTAKEYLKGGRAHEILKSWSPTPDHPESGMMMTLRYIVHLFDDYCDETLLPDPQHFPFAAERIIRCLRVLERDEGSCVGQMIEAVIMRFYYASPPRTPENFKRDLFCGGESTLKEIFIRKLLVDWPRPRAVMLALSIVWGLPLSIKLYMPPYREQGPDTPSEQSELTIEESDAVSLFRLTQGADDPHIPLQALEEMGLRSYISDSIWEQERSRVETPARIYLWS